MLHPLVIHCTMRPQTVDRIADAFDVEVVAAPVSGFRSAWLAGTLILMGDAPGASSCRARV